VGYFVILKRMGAAKTIKRKSEPFAKFLLDGVHFGAVFGDWKTGLVGG
jgi:hypothetical protein